MIENASEEVQKEKKINELQPIVKVDASIPDVPIYRNLIVKHNSEEPAEALKRLVFKQDRAFKSAYKLLEMDQKEDESECE